MSYPKTIIGECSKCGDYGFVSTHHRFKQKKWARKLYGYLLESPFNLVFGLCVKCHAIADSNDTLSETEFCILANIDVRSKTGR